MKKNIIKAIIVLGSISLALQAQAASESFGNHLAGHGTTELSAWFNFISLAVAFAGFLVVVGCLGGMITIKMASGTPMGQKAEAIGMMSFMFGAIIGGLLGAAGTVFYLFIATAAGSSADTEAFDKLNSHIIFEEVIQPDLSNLDTLKVTV
jgi:hypothetical protein